MQTSTSQWIALLLALGCTSLASADPPVAEAKKPHVHHEVIVDSRPVITRLPVRLQQPRRIHIRKNGGMLIADWGAGTIVSLQDGQSKILARDLKQPAGLAEDADGNILVAIYAGGEADAGSVIRLTPLKKKWEQTLVAEGLTGPTDVVVDPTGEVTIAEYSADRISRVASDGVLELGTTNLSTPSGLVLDADGRLFATSSKRGTVVSIPSSGEPIEICTGLESPSDLAVDEKDNLVAVSFLGNTIVRIEPDKKSFKRIASVPEGTIGVAYQKDGNFVVINWELQSATRVTNKLFVDCPHCDGRIPVRLKPNAKRKLF